MNLEFYRKNEGRIYGSGAARLAEQVALAVAAAKPTARSRAAAAGKVLRAAAKAAGHRPEIEVYVRNEGNGAWVASYEAGPYQWAIVASDALCQVNVFGEPNWSFDLCFYPEEK
jgi:hypothetical protein